MILLTQTMYNTYLYTPLQQRTVNEDRTLRVMIIFTQTMYIYISLYTTTTAYRK